MPESFLGDGLIFEEALPVVWTAGPLADGMALARLNADNHQLLGAEASLDEVRVHEALKDESPALVQELQRLEYKVNILLRLTSELALRNSGLPPAQRVRLTSRALEWFGERMPAVGSGGNFARDVQRPLQCRDRFGAGHRPSVTIWSQPSLIFRTSDAASATIRASLVTLACVSRSSM